MRSVIKTRCFDHWQHQLQQQLGNAQIELEQQTPERFSASIAVAQASDLQLIALTGETAGLRLQRRQSPDHGVFWLPISGYTQECVNAASSSPLEARPGQALWLAAGDQLDGHVAAGTTGLSILIPRPLLEQLTGTRLASHSINPFRISRRPTEVALLRAAHQCLEAAQHQPAWLETSAGEFWAALQAHAMAGEIARSGRSSEAIDRSLAERSSAQVTTDRFLALVTRELDHNPEVHFSLHSLSLALSVAPRTLQLHLQQELMATPKQVWQQLRREKNST